MNINSYYMPSVDILSLNISSNKNVKDQDEEYAIQYAKQLHYIIPVYK